MITYFWAAGIGLLDRSRMRRNREGKQGPVLLGFIMMMAGLYFVVSIIVVPVYPQCWGYSKAEALLSITAGGVGADLSFREAAALLVIVAFIFGLGFWKSRRAV